jgi:hypothetical protein
MLAYHGTSAVAAILEEGLRPDKTNSLGCPIKHICLSERPGVAAEYGTVVVVVDLEGFDEIPLEGFHNGEMRVHANIPPERIRVLDPQPEPNRRGWSDPGFTPEEQHPTCIRLREQH